MHQDDRVIVALDTSSLEGAKKILKELEGVIHFYKIGLELFTAHGWAAVDLVRKFDGRIFLDLKLHDIPTTVAKTVAVLCENEIEMFNVHTLGGFEMMKKAVETIQERKKPGAKKPILLGVTILTSHTEENLKTDLGMNRNLTEEVIHLAGLASRAGLDGIICSPLETALIRKEFQKNFVIVTPGVRSAAGSKEDQKRTLGPLEALQAGADHLVIGRPITAASNPREQAIEILNSIRSR